MISIVVPVYNVERYLDQCLESLSGQTFRDIEIVCVNDGSTDRSGEILEGHALKDNRLKVFTQQNGGISAARNRGIEEARGEWLMFVDADDWIDAVTCETALKAAIDQKADVVLWSYVRHFEQGRQSPRFLTVCDREFEGENLRLLHRRIVGPVREELRDPASIHSWGTVWGKLYRRNAVSAVRFTDTRIVGSAEDVLFNMEVFCRVERASYVHKAMYHYRKLSASFTGGHNAMLNERWVNLYAVMSDVIRTNDLAADFYEAFDSRIALGLIGQGLNECRSSRSPAGKIKMIRQIISTEQYRQAVTNLPLNYFPPHWRLFFGAARHRNAVLLFILLQLIRKKLK